MINNNNAVAIIDINMPGLPFVALPIIIIEKKISPSIGIFERR